MFLEIEKLLESIEAKNVEIAEIVQVRDTLKLEIAQLTEINEVTMPQQGKNISKLKLNKCGFFIRGLNSYLIIIR